MDYHDHTICYIKQKLVDIKTTKAVLEHKLNQAAVGSEEEDELRDKIALLDVRQKSLEQQKYDELVAAEREAGAEFGITCKAIAKMMEEENPDLSRIRLKAAHSDYNDEINRA